MLHEEQKMEKKLCADVRTHPPTASRLQNALSNMLELLAKKNDARSSRSARTTTSFDTRLLDFIPLTFYFPLTDVITSLKKLFKLVGPEFSRNASIEMIACCCCTHDAAKFITDVTNRSPPTDLHQPISTN
jgi:hypothetical protein